MRVFGPSPISATDLARRIASESDLTWDRSQRSIKNCLYKLGSNYGRVFCHRKGLTEPIDVHEWMWDLVWIDKTTGAMSLAVESEVSDDMRHRLDDFEKLMASKSPLKVFIYATGKPTESEDTRRRLAQYLLEFSQHLEGEEYLLVEIRDNRPHFCHYAVPNSGSVANVVFTPLELKQGSSA